MRRSLGIISGAFALRNHALALVGHVVFLSFDWLGRRRRWFRPGDDTAAAALRPPHLPQIAWLKYPQWLQGRIALIPQLECCLPMHLFQVTRQLVITPLTNLPIIGSKECSLLNDINDPI